MANGRKVISVDPEKILDYIQGECSESDMFKESKYRISTGNVYDRKVYRCEWNDYMSEWNDYE